MSYFKSFPIISYQVDQNTTLMQDLTRRTQYIEDLPVEAFTLYRIVDGETPDQVAYKFYGEAEYYWVIMLANEMFSLSDDWPLSDSQLYNTLVDQYGIDGIQETHHWEDSAGRVVNEDATVDPKVPVSYYDFYFKLNERKRTIRIPRGSIVGDIVTQHNQLVAK